MEKKDKVFREFPFFSGENGKEGEYEKTLDTHFILPVNVLSLPFMIRTNRKLEIVIHLMGWGMVFALPLFFFNRSTSDGAPWNAYVRHLVAPVNLLLVFYINYFLLIPKLLFTKKTREFLLYNLILVVGFGVLLHTWQEFGTPLVELPPRPYPGPSRWFFLIRDIVGQISIIGLSVAIRMSVHWSKTETARQEAEKNHIASELKNLRNQLNPHFLLNTLNNIYALIAFDSEKAQQAVHELSKLLRYVLYDNQHIYVSLSKEADFIRNYIELMKIRLGTHVRVETDIRIQPDSRTQITPLIFISLIENAFKHGISPTVPSYIHILLTETQKEVTCEIRNSYHPKNKQDKSGSGIGLEQVQRRLELLYTGRYKWKNGVSPDKKEYSSQLVIQP